MDIYTCGYRYYWFAPPRGARRPRV
jgi:hypothetical protein